MDLPPDDAAAPDRRSRLFGYDFDDLTQIGLVDRMERFIADGSRPRWVATINVNLLCLARRDPDYRSTLQSADVITADGMPIIWMSALRRRRLRARVTGSDLVLPLAERAAARGWRVFLAGGAPGVAERVAERMQEHAPGVSIVGTTTPPLMSYEELKTSEANEELLEAIRKAEPHVLLVALGSPKQERWIADHIAKGALTVPVSVGVGAAFDFQAGGQVRAPGWMRRTGLEWLFRMLRSPRRLLPRYARDGWTFARLCLREVLGGAR